VRPSDLKSANAGRGVWRPEIREPIAVAAKGDFELLYGRCNLDLIAEKRGVRVPVLDPKDGAQIGAAVGTRSHLRPVYISVGHRVSLESAI
jgi:Endonuclease V